MKKKGKELKIPYYTNAAATRDGNLSYIITTCLYSQYIFSFKIIILFNKVVNADNSGINNSRGRGENKYINFFFLPLIIFLINL